MAGRSAVSDRMRLGAIALALTAYLSAVAPASAQAPLRVLSRLEHRMLVSH